MASNYNFTENGVVYSFDDVFIPADRFREGYLWAWGFGGNLGTNDTIFRSTPVTTFSGGTNWKQVSSRRDHTAAIKTDGTLWTWGDGTYGRLGTNDVSDRLTPVTTFAGGTNWKQVSSGDYHTAAIKTDGTLWTWGSGYSGYLGTNDIISRSTPVTTFAGGNNWKQVSAGNYNTAAIKTDGTLWTWGSGYLGELGTNDTTDRSTPVTTIVGGTNWKQVSVAKFHIAAIKTDGTLWTWGGGFGGYLGRTEYLTPVTTFAGGTNWADTPTTEPEDLYTLSGGASYTAAIKTDGTLWTWGYGGGGRLGTNDTTDKLTPVTTFAGGTNWKQISSGRDHIAAIKTDGTLWTWGQGTSGQLGTNDATNRSTPVTTFAGGTNWKQVSAFGGAGSAHTAAIKTDGTLWTWGGGDNGTLGTNDTTTRLTPVTTFAGGSTAGGNGWKQVDVGRIYISAIKENGTLWTWGSGGYLGTNDTITRSTPVTTFAGGTNWKQVSCGYRSAAIKTDGTLWTWGFNGSGYLGTNDTITRSTPVTTFAGGTNWKQVSVAKFHIAAIKTDGTLWTWGQGTYGYLGTNDTITRSTPVTTFAGGTNWKQVSSGFTHTIALQDDGVNKRLYAFGSAGYGELGINKSGKIPDEIFGGGTNWKQVSSGSSHTAAIKTDGTLWTWGSGANGRLGTNNTTTRYTPVTTFAGGTNWKQVSSGFDHTSAIKTDGTLWTWGFNGIGYLGTNDTITRSIPVTTFAGGTNWKQVSAGYYFTTAIIQPPDPVL